MKVVVLLLILLPVSQTAFSVEVEEGEESVILPCQVDASVSKGSTVLWVSDELKDSNVHTFTSSGDPAQQNPRYRSRTIMRSDALETGNLNLTLRKPTRSDSGNYTCSTHKGGVPHIGAKVQLLVRERSPPPPVWPLLVAGVLAALAAVALLITFCACKREKNRPEYLVETVEMSARLKSVLLPFKTTTGLSNDNRVEWRRVFPKSSLVLGYQLDPKSAGKPRGDFIGRTDVKEDLLRSGDFSLTLKKPSSDDCGLYICSVLKAGEILRQKAVALTGVTGVQIGMVEVTEGEKSVLLPFITTPNLGGNVTVKWWRHPFDADEIVHVYQSGQTRPEQQQSVFKGRAKMQENPLSTGDLSLTLSDPSCDHQGFYICTVYVDGKVLKQKVVALSVRETLMGTVRGVFQSCTKRSRNSTNPTSERTDLLADDSV